MSPFVILSRFNLSVSRICQGHYFLCEVGGVVVCGHCLLLSYDEHDVVVLSRSLNMSVQYKPPVGCWTDVQVRKHHLTSLRDVHIEFLSL